MKARYPTAVLLALAAGITCISLPSAQSGLDGTAYGVIESVREVLLETLEGGIAGIVQHAIGPSDEVVVRLDDGRVVTVVQNDAQFEPGQRVLVLAAGRSARVQHATY